MPSVAVDSALRAAPNEVGSLLLELTEDQWFDRKSSRIESRSLAKALAGMANAEGGHIVVGLSDGRIEGFSAGDRKINDLRQASMDFLNPAVSAPTRLIECRSAVGTVTHLLDFDVSPSSSIHVTNKDEVFLRVGDENRRLTFAQRQELEFDKGQAAFENRIIGSFTMNDLDRSLIENYQEVTDHPDAERLLTARGLALNGNLTAAGCLLFSEYPQREFPEAFVRVLRYRGDTREAGSRQQLLDDETFEGPIPKQLISASSAIDRLQPTRKALTSSGVFGDIGLVPRDAWLEGLVNAAIHRSYSLSGDHIRIEIFDTRIEISSPGRFPGLVNLDNPMSAPRFARNPRIARVCSDLNFGQELGEGIRRMYEEMQLAGLEDPMYVQTQGSVELTLSGTPIDRDLEARLPPEHRRIRTLLRDGERLSTGEIAESLDLSRPATIKRLKALETEGFIRWVGKAPNDPRAFWTLVDR